MYKTAAFGERLSDAGNRLANIVWKIMPDWQQEHTIALGEQFSLDARSDKYQKITTALFLASTFNPFSRFLPGRPTGFAPGLYAAYHFCRMVDDIADGDQSIPNEYETFQNMTADLKNAMRYNKYPNSDIGILLRGLVRDTRTYHGFDIKADLAGFLDAMEYESERRKNKTLSTTSELYDLYQQSFGTPQNIAFRLAGSKVRSRDIPELAEVQGRMYAIRDLTSELSRGIIFVPREVVPSDLCLDDLCKRPYSIPEINKWISDEVINGKCLIDDLKKKKLDWTGRRIVNFLLKSIEKDIKAHIDKVF